MSALIAVPLLVLLTGFAGRRWVWSRRRDARSIESHRSTLGVIEHVSGADEGEEGKGRAGSTHVRVVSGSVAASPRMRPDPPTVRPSPPPLLASSRKVPAAGGSPATGQIPSWRVTSRERTPHRSGPLPPATARSSGRLLKPPAAARMGETPAVGAEADPPVIVFVDESYPAGTAAGVPVGTGADESLAIPAGEDPGIAASEVAARSVAHAVAEEARFSSGAPARLVARPRLPRPPAVDFPLRAGLAAAVALAVLGGGAYTAAHYLSRSPSHSGTSAQGAPSPSATVRAPVGTAPATTVPVPAVTSDGSGTTYADYTVAATSVDVSVVVTRSCWVEVRDGSETGPISYEGTLATGVSQNFESAGGLWIRLGDPVGVTMSIDGAPVDLPRDSSPFDVAVAGSTRT